MEVGQAGATSFNLVPPVKCRRTFPAKLRHFGRISARRAAAADPMRSLRAD